MRSSSRMPPPTSIFKPPCLAMAAMACRLAGCSSLAPSRSTTCRYLAPAGHKGFGLGHGVGVVDGHLVVVALVQTHGLAAP